MVGVRTQQDHGRGAVLQVFGEFGLADVPPDADHHLGQSGAQVDALHQDAGDLPVGHLHVVRPFDARVREANGMQHLHQGQSGQLRDQRDPVRPIGPEQEAERQIQPGATHPRALVLPESGRLMFGQADETMDGCVRIGRLAPGIG